MPEFEYEVVLGPLEALHNRREHGYCPGCEHGILTRLIAKALSELELKEKAVGVASVGAGEALAFSRAACKAASGGLISSSDWNGDVWLSRARIWSVAFTSPSRL